MTGNRIKDERFSKNAKDDVHYYSLPAEGIGNFCSIVRRRRITAAAITTAKEWIDDFSSALCPGPDDEMGSSS